MMVAPAAFIGSGFTFDNSPAGHWWPDHEKSQIPVIHETELLENAPSAKTVAALRGFVVTGSVWLA
jgi:hypothetical protein